MTQSPNPSPPSELPEGPKLEPARDVYYRLDLTKDQAHALLKFLTEGSFSKEHEGHLITVGEHMRRLITTRESRE